MTHGWNTRQTQDGFKWAITQTVWSDEAGRAVTTTLKAGMAPTRARATGLARRWVLFFRRGGSL